jgi:hypothetical protein
MAWINISCLRMNGVHLWVPVLPDATVGDLKAAMAAHKDGLPADQQRLIGLGRWLDNDAVTLRSLEITRHTIITVVRVPDGRGISAKRADPPAAAVLADEGRVYDVGSLSPLMAWINISCVRMNGVHLWVPVLPDC